MGLGVKHLTEMLIGKVLYPKIKTKIIGPSEFKT